MLKRIINNVGRKGIEYEYHENRNKIALTGEHNRDT